MLSLDRLQLMRGGKKIVSDASMDVYHGDWLSLLGPSGSGKSTLLNAIMGFLVPRKGRILWKGKILNDDRKMMVFANQRKFAHVAQDSVVFPHLSLIDNMTLGLGHLAKNMRRSLGLGMIEKLGLLGKDGQIGSEFSGGEQQRICIGRALLTKPELLLLDEPFNHLDRVTRAELWNLVKKLCAEEHTTVLHVTHDPEESLSLADRIAILIDGKIGRIGSPREIYDHPQCFQRDALLGPINRISPDCWLKHWSRTPLSKELFLRPHHMDIALIGQSRFQPNIRGVVKKILYKGHWTEVLVKAHEQLFSVATLQYDEWRVGTDVELAIVPQKLLDAVISHSP